MELDGFAPYLMTTGGATISFSKNGIGVSKTAVAKLKNSPHVKILIDRAGRRLAIQVCEADDPAATDFARTDKLEGTRWNSRDLNATIRQMTGWDVNNNKLYRVEGTYVHDDKYPALIFDLTTPIS